MKKPNQNKTKYGSFYTILRDFHYPCTNPIDNTIYWTVSRDIQNEQSIKKLELVEKFVDTAQKSTVSPFVFVKTLNGTILKRGNQLGTEFYYLLSTPHHINAILGGINGYEVSENFKVYESIARDLNLHQVNFTGDPSSELCPGVCEGELVNSFVTRLQETTRRKCFKKKADERKKESTQGFTKSKRYVERLYANTSCLFGVSMSAHYQSHHAKSITLEESNNHLRKFLEPFETNSAIGSPVGWWWKREYMTETSYRNNLIFFFDAQKGPFNPMWLDAYGRHWVSTTNEEGAYFIPLVPKWPYRFSEAGSFQQEYTESLDSILSNIHHQHMRDVFLRLKRNKKIDHFGMGELPKLLGGTSKSSFTTLPHRF